MAFARTPAKGRIAPAVTRVTAWSVAAVFLFASPSYSQEISCGQALTASISTAGERDRYMVQRVSQGDTVTLRIVKTSGNISTPYLELFDGKDSRVATGFGELTKRLDTPGPYSVMASDYFGSGTGDYRLFLQRVNNPCQGADQATDVNCGANLAGTLSSVGEIDTYVLLGIGPGDTAALRIVETSGNLSTPYLELYDGTGTRIATGFGELTKRLDAAGPYTVFARDYFDSRTGSYRLAYQRVNNPCQATVLPAAQTISGSIREPGALNAYTFGAGAGTDVTICLVTTAESISAFMDLYDTAGTRLTGSFSEIRRRVSTASTFNLLLKDYFGAGTGNYRLRLENRAISCGSLDLIDPTVSVVAPKAGELVEAGSTFAVTWRSSDNVGVVSHEVRLSTDGGTGFPTAIATGLAGNVQSFRWSVPAGLKTTTGRIRVIARDAAGNAGQSDNSSDFVILAVPTLTTVRYKYDELNRLTYVDYSGGSTVTYTYDRAGNRTTLIATAPPPGPLVLSLDSPSGTVSGTAVGSGWAFQCNGGVARHELLVDGVVRPGVRFTTGLARPDVASAYRATCPTVPINSGYTFSLDPAALGLAPGTHQIQVRVSDVTGATAESNIQLVQLPASPPAPPAYQHLAHQRPPGPSPPAPTPSAPALVHLDSPSGTVTEAAR